MPSPTTPYKMRIDNEHSGRRRLWSETVPFAQLCDPALLRALSERGLELIVSVRPGQLDATARLAARARAHDLHLGVWPMLSDADGRWANIANAERFAGFARAVLDRMAADGLIPRTFALDLEPSIRRMRGMLRGKATSVVPERGASAPLRSLCDDLHARGIEVLAAVVPLLLADPEPGGGWQRILDTPLSDLQVDRVSPMLYTSLALGYARGVLRRRDVRALLHRSTRACAHRFGPRAAVSLGAVGTGALGDEALFEGPSQLADDVALCRAAGVEDIALFDLGGVLRRGGLDRWLDALQTTTPAVAAPPLTRRARLTLTLARAVGLVGQRR